MERGFLPRFLTVLNKLLYMEVITMAESNFIYYRGFPMVRSGNEIYYGSMGDRFVTKLTIRESEKYKDAEIPTKVMVQMIPTSPTPEDLAKIRKGEMNSLYEALDTAHVWLTKELFGA